MQSKGRTVRLTTSPFWRPPPSFHKEVLNDPRRTKTWEPKLEENVFWFATTAAPMRGTAQTAGDLESRVPASVTKEYG